MSEIAKDRETENLVIDTQTLCCAQCAYALPTTATVCIYYQTMKPREILLGGACEYFSKNESD